MKFLPAFFLGALILIQAASIQAAGDNALRNVKWGMTVAQVQKAENARGEWIDNCLCYEDTMAGRKFRLMYSFRDGRLCMAAYKLLADYANANAYILVYDDFLKLLKAKYGEPAESFIEGERERFIDSARARGELLASGKVRVVNRWRNRGTTIGLTLDNDGRPGNISMHILYICPPELFEGLGDTLSDTDKL